MKTKLFRLAVILLVTALFIIGGCAVDEKGSAPAEEVSEETQEPTIKELPSEKTPAVEDDFDISTVDIESDLDLSDLEDIDAQLEDINW